MKVELGRVLPFPLDGDNLNTLGLCPAYVDTDALCKLDDYCASMYHTAFQSQIRGFYRA